MRRKFICFIIIHFFIVSYVNAAILVQRTSGIPTQIATLESARTSSDLSGATIIITSALTQTESNISGAWPSDRALRIVKGGSINNTTKFIVLGPFDAGLYSVFTGTGDVIITSTPVIQGKWFGMIDDCNGNIGTDNSTALNKAIFTASKSGIPLETNGRTYLVKKPIYLKSNLNWRGNGTIRAYINGSEFNRAFTTEDDGISTSYRLQHVKLHNLRFEKYQDKASGSYHLFIIHNADDIEFNGCYFNGNISRLKDIYNGGDLAVPGITIGISPFDNFVKSSRNIRFINNVLEQGWNAGFAVGTATNVLISGNQFIDCIARAVDIEVSNSDDISQGIIISGNTFNITDNVDGGALSAAQLVITEYYVSKPFEKGSINPENQWISITGNTFIGDRASLTSNGAAIIAAGGTGVIISGNTGYRMHSKSNASLIINSSSAKLPSKPQYFSIYGNTFDGKFIFNNLIYSTITGNSIKNGGYDYALIESGTSFANTYIGNILGTGQLGALSFSDKRNPVSARIGNIFINDKNELAHQTFKQPDSTATDFITLKSDFNALLSKLRKANILQP